MSTCPVLEPGDLELHFYGELDEASETRVVAHLRTCSACRTALDELGAISSALAEAATVEAPANGDWTPFMERLGHACPAEASGEGGARPAEGSRDGRAFHAWAVAAMFVLLVIGGYIAARSGALPRHSEPIAQSGRPAPAVVAAAPGDSALREVAADHIERSKIVVLGLAMRDPRRTTPEDWQYERRLAASLLSDTRLYRMAAQEKGINDVAHVLRDLETVLLEASLSDDTDRGALERVQRLISKRDLVVKMQVVAASTGI